MTDTTRRQALASGGLALLGASFGSSSAVADNSPSTRGPHMNVRDFGAQGDGITDETAAFQRALETTAHAGGDMAVPTKPSELVDRVLRAAQAK